MPNPLQVGGAQPPRPSKKGALYVGARWSSGLWSNRSAIRDAASTRLEEKFYGPRGDAFLGGENLEISQKLTVIRRPGNSPWNNNTWSNVNSFYSFRVFDANTEDIKVMVDTKTGLYESTHNSQHLIWSKSPYSGQSYMQSVGNILYWGDGQSEKKWISTLQTRIPYSTVLETIREFPNDTTVLNPYNFTPFALNSFIVDPNGNAEQLIGTVVQILNFYILDSVFVFTMLGTDSNSNPLPTASQVLSSGLQLYFPKSSAVAEAVGTSDLTLTVQNIAGPLTAGSVQIYFGGQGYSIGQSVSVTQTTPAGSFGGQVKITATGTSAGQGYTNNPSVLTTTSGKGTGLVLNVTTSAGSLVSATVVTGGVNYATGDFIFLGESTGTGGYFRVTGVTTGAVTSVAVCTGVATAAIVTVPGNGYVQAQNVPTDSAPATSNGLALNITTTGTQFTCSSSGLYTGGPITSVSTGNSLGSGYHVGDVLFPVVPTQSQASGGVIEVLAISGTPASLSIFYGGPSFTGYTVASGLATTTSGAGTGATFNILTVSSGQIATFSLGSGGTGYNVGDAVYPVQATGAGAQYSVSTVSGTTITGLTPVNTGYLPYSVATNVPTTTSSTTGSGATVDITTVASGAITGIAINTPGTGYTIGDRLYPTQSGTSGNAQIRIDSLTSGTGGAAILQLNSGGSGYVTSTNVATISPESGTGATVNITAGSSFFPITTISETIHVYSGGNPISSYTANEAFQWATVAGDTTVDGSAFWINRGAAVNEGLVYNWGLPGGNTSPTVTVNGAVGSWKPNTYYNRWQFIVVTVGSDKYVQQLVSGGVSAGSTPPWSTVPGQITTDGSAKWMCLSNDGDTTMAWNNGQVWTPGHVIEETVSAVSCVFRLQQFTGITTTGSNFPIYCWQCNSQSGSDVGAAAELPNGVSGNTPMAQNGGQTTSSATFTGTVNSLFLSAQGGSNAVKTAVIAGDGTVPGSLTTLFPSATQNLSLAMLPVFNIPAAGDYTFQIGHQVAMFWGIGSGSVTINVTQVQMLNGVLTITSDQDLSQLLTTGLTFTFSGLANATFLNGQSVTIASISGYTFTATFTHSNYGPAADTGMAQSGATLAPSRVSGPLNWNHGSPNTYDFTSGTPIKGYPIMSANYPNQGNNIVTDTVVINFPSAGTYPVEIQYGVWYHSTGSYSTPTTSPALPGTTFSFYMIYQPPNSSTFYNIVPQAIACTDPTTPTFPAWPTNISGLQAEAPSYPNVTEANGNYTWWNLGPSATFDWNMGVGQTTDTFIVDQNSNEQIPYEAGVSGTAEPTFSTTLYGLTQDLDTLTWMNDGPVGSTASGTLTTDQGGWRYAIALVNTIDDTVSNASLISDSTGNFFDATGVFVSGGLPQFVDPQADYVAVFRTDDGGATYFLIPPPTSGNGNTEYTLPLSQYLAEGFTDTTPDSMLDTLFQAPLARQNSTPPRGSVIPAYNYGRIFVAKGNTVYWSAGPTAPVGNGYNGFPPSNFAVFPSRVVKLTPLNIGILVQTVSDIFIIAGNGTASNPFNPQPFLQKVGLLSYNASTVNGSIVYFMTTDQQVVELNVHSGLTAVGYPIADILENIDPTAAYLTWHVNGSNDQCLFVADGSTGWYRMSPTPAPEVGALTWSLKANIVGGCGAIQSVETSPGDIQMLVAPPPGSSGPILVRDYTTNQDNGSPYPANFILGSIVLAYPGQVGAPEFITTDCIRAPLSRPLSLSVRIGEISGPFEVLRYWTNDPPQLPESLTLYNQRFYMSQTKQSVLCRHMQVLGSFDSTNSPDELSTLTVVGSYLLEE